MDLDTSNITYDAVNTDAIETWIPAAALDLFKYELKGANSFETTINSSRENGTTFFEQTLTVQFKKQDIATHKNIKMLAYGRPRIVVRSMTDQFFLMGLDQGADVTAGTISSGSALGDFNGYGLTFTAQEGKPCELLRMYYGSGTSDFVCYFYSNRCDYRNKLVFLHTLCEAVFLQGRLFYLETNTTKLSYISMIVLQETGSAQTFSFIPRSQSYDALYLTDDQTNVEVQVTIDASTQGDYLDTITATFTLTEGHFYNLVVKDGADVVFKDRVFCTNQAIVSFSVNNGQYTSNSTTNDFIVYE
jgi:hypothetical protein